MNQVVAPDVPVLVRMPFNDVDCGFMRDDEGKIFFLMPQRGKPPLAFPLLEDGSLGEEVDMSIASTAGSVVTLVHWRDVGIEDIDDFLDANELNSDSV
jgi:hypothetical protein